MLGMYPLTKPASICKFFSDFVDAKWRFVMPKAPSWHSIKSQVYHNNTACNTGNNIERENRRSGTGDKKLCSECANLNKQGR